MREYTNEDLKLFEEIKMVEHLSQIRRCQKFTEKIS